MVNDMMSQQFRAMNMAMSSVISSFQHMQNVSGSAVDTAALEAAQRELQLVESRMNEVEQEIRQAENAQENLNRDIRNGTDAASGLLSKLGAIVGTYLTLQGLGDAISLSDEMTNTIARLDLINDGLQTTIELQQIIFDSAKRSYAPYLATADLVGKLAMNASDAFGSTAETVAFAELLNKSFSNAGTNAEGIASATLQLTQALGAGALRGEELNAVLEAAPGIVQNIEKYLSISRGELREMASDGQITAEIVKQSMFAAADDINQKFASMPVTWSQIWTNFKNDALKAFQPVLQEINNLANNEKVQEFVSNVSQSMFVLVQLLLNTIQIISSIAGFFYDNWSQIGPLITTVAVGLGTYATYMLVAKSATILMTAAQWALNAAMNANPIGLVIMALVALALIYQGIIGLINHFAGTSLSATGVVAGAFMFLFALIYNSVANLWNVFAAFWEFFANVAKDPIYVVKKLFYNLASSFLDQTIAMISGWDSFATSFVNAMIDAVNGAIKAWNWFVGLLPDDIASSIGLKTAGEFSHRTSITSDLGNLRKGLDDWIGEAPSDYWEAPKMEFQDVRGAWDMGYNWGANLFKGSDLSQSSSFDMNELLNGLGDTMAPGNDAAKDTAGNTKKLADSVDLATDDLAYLRDIAERESINRYTTGNIKIEVKNDNHINNDMDIDGVIDRFAERLEEAVDTVAEGADGDV